MAGPNFPCRNPKVCGVKSHRNGTHAKCMDIPDRKTFRRGPATEGGAAKGASKESIAAYKVKLQNMPEPYQLDDRGLGIKNDIFQGVGNIEVELPEGDTGERRFLILNAGSSDYEDGMSEYWEGYMNRKEGAKIITASGIEVYAGSHRGGSLTRNVLSDGVVRSGPVIPINRDAELVDSRITAAEYDALCDLDQEAEALAYIDGATAEWADLKEQEIIGRAVDMAKDGWSYRPRANQNPHGVSKS